MYVRGHGGDLDPQRSTNVLHYQHAPIASKSSMKMIQPSSRVYGSTAPVMY